MAEKKLEVKETVKTKSKTTTKKTPPKKAAAPKPKTVKIIWPYLYGKPGDLASFYGIQCVADKDGTFTAEVSEEVAERELNRPNRQIFDRG